MEHLEETNTIAADIQALNVKQVAQILNKSEWWVYKHADLLCASRIGGSLIFTRDNLERSLNANKRTNGKMESNFQNQRKTTSKNIRNQDRGKKMGSRGKSQAEIYGTYPARHGLANILFQIFGSRGN
jgi:hypothetical protein